MMIKRKRRPTNLLTMRPCLSRQYALKTTGECEYLIQPRTGWIEKVGVNWFNQSPEHRYQLDDLGSFVLKRCNGTQTVSEIEAELRDTFGEKAEPTLNRLVKFLQILDNNCVISFEQTGAD